MYEFLSWAHDMVFPIQPKENEFQFRVWFFLLICFKQERDVNEMSADSCVRILARISNLQAVKRVSGPHSVTGNQRGKLQ